MVKNQKLILFKISKSKRLLLIILLLGLILRIIFNGAILSNDTYSFVIWANYLKENPMYKLYETLPGNYLPYPPFYYFILTPFGYLFNLLNLSNWQSLLVIKLPVFASEIAATLIIYDITKRWIAEKHAIAASSFFFLNPAIIFVSSAWGQIDAVIIMFALVFIYLFLKKNFLYALIAFLLGTTIKLQTLALLPLVSALSVTRIIPKRLLQYSVILIILVVLIFLPILSQKGITWTAKYMYSLPNQYPYTSVYAYNLWSPRGFIESDKNKFLSLIEYRYLGLTIFWVGAFLVVYPLLKKKKNLPEIVLFASLILFFSFYYFSTRIHSRYLIYSVGFMAPFFIRYPKASIALTLLIISNLFLPLKSWDLPIPTQFLEKKFYVYFFTIYGLFFYIWLITEYRKLIIKS